MTLMRESGKKSHTLRVERLRKVFGNTVAVDDISFTTEPGEITAFLGPSGCGKTTTLRIVAGLEDPTNGHIFIDQDEISGIPAHRRDIGLVFQDYALFPHKTVKQNIEFGLKIKKLDQSEIERRVKASLQQVNLLGKEDRYPQQLSGGEQQRVAVARTLVTEPRILLFDEPLSNLDAKLRESTRLELHNLQRKLGITSIYVTHDQIEAFAIADKIMLMNKGKIEQFGTPEEIYAYPSTAFAADFIGTSNILETTVTDFADGFCVLHMSSGHEIKAPIVGKAENITKGEKLLVMIRTQKVNMTREKPTEKGINVLPGTCLYKVFLGDSTRCLLEIDGIRLIADCESECVNSVREGEVYISFDYRAVVPVGRG
ncbi:MAG: ABC transporter ATP-binding protein [Theionarchaea archaeon]|nr:ABC transporter ATP-binding protein [Theionarchaea archaeon]